MSSQISRQLSDVLRRNGVSADIVSDDTGLKLNVQAAGSPVVSYDISASQAKALSTGSTVGLGTANKRAYETFYAIASQDFVLPRHYVQAQNTGSMVNMGQNGYRTVTTGWENAVPSMATPPIILPRRRFVIEEISATKEGGRGPGQLEHSEPVSWKGPRSSQGATIREIDPLADLQTPEKVKYDRPAPDPYAYLRGKETALTYKEAIPSDVYFSKDAFKSVLEAHGIAIDEDSRRLTVLGKTRNDDRSFELTQQQLAGITEKDTKKVPVQEKLDVINLVISKGFDDTVTMEMLQSKSPLQLRPAVQLPPPSMQELSPAADAQPEKTDKTLQSSKGNEFPKDALDGIALRDEKHTKGWYKEDGSEADVAKIWVERSDAHTQYTAVVVKDPSLKPDKENLDRSDYVVQKVEMVRDGEKIRFTGLEHQMTQQEAIVVAKKMQDLSRSEKKSDSLVFEITASDLNRSNDLSRQPLPDRQDRKDMIRVEASMDEAGQVSLKGISGKLSAMDAANITLLMRENPNLVPSPGQSQFLDISRNGQTDGALRQEYTLHAVIDGREVSHEISAKEYEKFQSLDDYHKMKMLDKVFSEVDIKTRPEYRLTVGEVIGTIGMAVSAAGHAAASVAMSADVIRHPENHRYPAGGYDRVVIYGKPGVDTPESLASRAWDATVNAAERDMSLGRGR